MNRICLVVLVGLAFSACKKESNITPSHWKIDGVEYSSDNVEKGIGKAVAAINGRDADRFDITFYWSYLPTFGTYDVVPKNMEQNPMKVVVNIYRGEEIYKIDAGEITKLEASEVDGKAKYTLPLSWFVSYYDPTDSVQIEGVFFEP